MLAPGAPDEDERPRAPHARVPPAGPLTSIPGKSAEPGACTLLASLTRADALTSTSLPEQVWVPRTLSTPRDQAILVDQTTDASRPSDAVLLKIDRFG